MGKEYSKEDKKEKIRFYIATAVCVVGLSYMALLVTKISGRFDKYEFIDAYGNWGTSNFCGEVKAGSIDCIVNDMYVPVTQYSKIKGGSNNDFWKER